MICRRKLSITLALILVVLGHRAANAQEVSVTLADGPLTRGNKITGTLVLSIPEGLHVNSNKPSSEYLIATAVRIAGDGLKVDKIEYPLGKNRKFQFSEAELNVYEGDVSIPFSLTVLKSAKKKKVALKALVSYQACTEEVCFPPKKKEIVVTAQIR